MRDQQKQLKQKKESHGYSFLTGSYTFIYHTKAEQMNMMTTPHTHQDNNVFRDAMLCTSYEVIMKMGSLSD